MSESEMETEATNGIKISRFHGKRGEDYGLWRLRLRASCRVKGVWGVVDSSAPSSSTLSTNEDYTAHPDATILSSRIISKREKASGIINSALGDVPLWVVLEAYDDPGRMLELLDSRYASNRTVSRIAVQTQLFRMTYTDQDMSTYVDHYTYMFAQLKQMGKDIAIPDTHKAPMLLASIDPHGPLESAAAALRTKNTAELTWDYVATTLIDEYNARHQSSFNSRRPNKNRTKRKQKNKRGSTASLSSKQYNYNSDSDYSDTEVSDRALSAAFKSLKLDRASNGKHHCNLCDKDGHTGDRCFLNPENPNNKLPPKVRQLFTAQSKVSSANCSGKKSKVEIAGAMITKTTICPPQNMASYADSGATVHCFHSENVFVAGTLESCDERIVMLADKTSVVAKECGDVILPFENANIRLKRALYIPNLGYNLVSTGMFADKGIESHFGREDVRFVLTKDKIFIGKGIRHLGTGMYVLPEPVIQHTPEKAMSLFVSDTTELWHRRLAHINSRDLLTLHKHVEGCSQAWKFERCMSRMSPRKSS